MFYSAHPDEQPCKAYCSCHLQIIYTKSHNIISWFYDPSLQFNCFIWLYKALAEINIFKSLAFFQSCLFPRYQSWHILVFYHQRDESNCLDHTNCIIGEDVFGSTVQSTFPMANSEKLTIKIPPLVPTLHPEGKSVGKRSI